MIRLFDPKELLPLIKVIQFLECHLDYDDFDDWKDREKNSNIEEVLLTDWLTRERHNDKISGMLPTNCAVRKPKRSNRR